MRGAERSEHIDYRVVMSAPSRERVMSSQENSDVPGGVGQLEGRLVFGRAASIHEGDG